MPRFEPFRGLRYDARRADLADVTAPPYDVIDAADRARLAARHPQNVVHVDVPVDDGSGADCYAEAAKLLATWRHQGVLVDDPSPSFTRYRMTFTDEAGHQHRTLGVIGALEASRTTEGGGVLPHERTTPKATSDRLRLLQATATNLSPVWGLSLATGLSGAIAPADGGEPDARWTDDGGVTHECWRIDDPEVTERIRILAGSAPVVIADGHHRYDVALSYRDERRAAASTTSTTGSAANAAGAAGAGAPYDLTLALLVELSPEQLVVQPIHRLLTGFGSLSDLTGALERSFTAGGSVTVTPAIVDRLVADGALALVAPDGTGTLLYPRPGAFAGVADLDSARLDHALAGVPHVQAYQHGVDLVRRRLAAGEADAAVLLRPVTVAAIQAMADARGLMPPKSTFFAPKPATGVVFRPV